MPAVPGNHAGIGLGKSGLTFPVRFEVPVHRGWLDLAAAAGASVQRKGSGWVAQSVKVMRPWAHGDVDTLGTVPCSLHGQQGRGAWIHGHVVIFRIGTVRSAQHCLPRLGRRRKATYTGMGQAGHAQQEKSRLG